jgi:hypothetical protein
MGAKGAERGIPSAHSLHSALRLNFADRRRFGAVKVLVRGLGQSVGSEHEHQESEYDQPVSRSYESADYQPESAVRSEAVA